MKKLLLLAALAACHPAAPRAPSADRARIVVVISASAEWKIISRLLAEPEVRDTPFGAWVRHRIAGEDVVFFHGGYGKINAAGSAQYALDRWHPALVVNLGTCGGFGGERKVGDLVLASQTVVYDAIERMDGQAHVVTDFNTRLANTAWPARLADRVVTAPLVSADADLDPAAVAALHATYHAAVGDWESGAIAFVVAHNHAQALILRGVTDLVDAGGDATYNAPGAWERASEAVMASLLALFSDAVPDLRRAL